MNDSEIIKALECCTLPSGCNDCPYVSKSAGRCSTAMVKDAFGLIKRQQAEIDRLNIDLKAMRGAANSYKAHYEDLKSENLETIKILKTAKSATVREFAENLKSRKRKIIINDNYSSASLPLFIILPDDIDKLMEETGCNDG